MLKVAAFLVFVAVAAAVTTYEGHKVYRLHLSTDVQIQFVDKASKGNIGISLWTALKKGQVDVMVPPKANRLFHLRLKELEITHKVIMEDVQKVIETQRIQNDVAKLNAKERDSKALDHTFYRTLDEIYVELDDLVAAFPELFTLTVIGQTAEGRDIKVMKVSSDNTDTKEAVFLDCGIHAREWVSTATCLYILDNLSGPDLAMLDRYDFHIIVSTNPDGYEYTWTDDRQWRKNRVDNDEVGQLGNPCFGVDPNRNYDAHFSADGASNNSCSDTYCGTSPFSEAESAACRDTILGLGSRAKIAFSVHAYSQYWMTPYGYQNGRPADYAEMMRVATVGSDALTAVYGTTIKTGQISEVIYVASGSSVDWYYDNAGVVYAYALELRDEGEFGFILPADQILPTAIETWTGFKAAINAVP